MYLPVRFTISRPKTRRVLVRETGRRGWKRIALTERQAGGLPAIEKLDRRYKPPRQHRAIEVEALGQGVVTAIVRKALDRLLPEPLDDVRERQQTQRDEWRSRLNGQR